MLSPTPANSTGSSACPRRAQAVAFALGWPLLGASADTVGETPRGGGPERAAQGATEEGENVTAYGILRRKLEFQDSVRPGSLSRALPSGELADHQTLPVPLSAPPGSLVRLRVTSGYRGMALADGRHLAVRRGFSPEDYDSDQSGPSRGQEPAERYANSRLILAGKVTHSLQGFFRETVARADSQHPGTSPPRD